MTLPFFGTGMKTDLFQSSGHCWVFQFCWHIQCSTFTASSFWIWNSSAGIPSPPLALFIVMLPKAHLTSHSRRHQIKEFSILHSARCKSLGSLNSFFSCAPQLSGANPVSLFTLLLAFPPVPQQSPWRWQHLYDDSFGSPHSHLEAKNHWWLWYFLSINMAADIFISYRPKQL